MGPKAAIVLAMLAAGLAAAAVAPPPDERPRPSGDTAAVAADEPGRAARPLPAPDSSPVAEPALRQAGTPPYFALPPRLRPRSAGAGWRTPPEPGERWKADASRAAGDWQAAWSDELRPVMAMPAFGEVPAPRARPVAAGSSGSGGELPDRRGLLGDLFDAMGSPEADAVKRWSPTHDPDPVPSRFVKGRPVNTRTPDVEFGVNPHTSLGLYGEITRPEKGDPLAGTGPVRSKDHGAGVTLQYRFGSQ